MKFFFGSSSAAVDGLCVVVRDFMNAFDVFTAKNIFVMFTVDFMMARVNYDVIISVRFEYL